MVIIITAVRLIPDSNVSVKNFDFAVSNILGTMIICSLLMIAFGIPALVLWILGIINAIAINTLTNDSAVLVVFSIITFGFVHLIIEVVQKNKFSDDEIKKVQSQNQVMASTSNDFTVKKNHLDQALMNGVINSSEY
ncbi:MAG: hypothetical protein KAG14_03130 [Mycoplasmataceae bacterium]|nr:hypothetical protein [Mycoplasmataceae bacterium]